MFKITNLSTGEVLAFSGRVNAEMFILKSDDEFGLGEVKVKPEPKPKAKGRRKSAAPVEEQEVQGAPKDVVDGGIGDDL